MVRRAMLWTAFIGLFASTYLLIVYVTGGPIACGIVSGCEIVRASKWAYTFGIPRPFLGVVFYLGVIGLLVVRLYSPKHRPKFWTTLTILMAAVGFIESAFLTLLQTFEIKAYCIWCLVSAVMATILFSLSFFEGEQDLEGGAALRELQMTFYSFAVAILAGGLMLWMLLLGQSNKTTSTMDANADVASLIFPAGTEFEGSTSATVTVVEFVDVPCPICRAFEPIMQRIRAEYHDRIRFAYRTFMLPEVHKFAKESAIAAQCAGKQGKMIPYTSAAILNQDHLERKDLVGYADSLHLDVKQFERCLNDPSVATIVEDERKAGERLGVNSTPSLFLNNTLIRGVGTYEQVKKAIEDELKASAK